MVAAKEGTTTSMPTVEVAAVRPDKNKLPPPSSFPISVRLSSTLITNKDDLIQALTALSLYSLEPLLELQWIMGLYTNSSIMT